MNTLRQLVLASVALEFCTLWSVVAAMEVGAATPASQNSPAPAVATNPPDKSADKPGGTPVTYGVYHYIDEGGLRDPRTGQWLEGFRILVPKGWKFTGGFRWMAREKPANLLSRTDLLNPVKSDYTITSPDGRSVFRQYPVEYWVQTNMFQPGQNYNGMIVCAALTPEQYITQFVIPRQRGLQATDMKIVKQEPLDQLAAKYEAESQQFATLTGGAATGSALAFKAGTVTIDYTDSGVACREQFLCIQQYLQTAGMVMWWPRMNFSVRAPREQFDAQLPVFTTIALSVQTNPYWSIALIELREKIKVPIAQADAYANKVRREIAASHAQTNHELAKAGGYLSSDYYDYKGTDGNRYNLPTDKYHFMNKDGDIRSQDSSVPPSSEWTSIEPYNQ